MATQEVTTSPRPSRQWFGIALHRLHIGVGGIETGDQERVGPFNTKAEAYEAAFRRMVELGGFGMIVNRKEVHHG